MIIDIHAHAWPEKVSQRARASLESYYTVKCAGDPTITTLRDFMDRNGIDVSVVCAVASRPEQVVSINNWLFSRVDGRVKAFASLHPLFSGWRDEIRRIKDKASGVKFQPSFQSFYVDDESVFPVYEELEKSGLPVLFHSGDELAPQMVIRATPKRLLKVKEKFSGMTMIAAHLGGFRQWEEVETTLLGKDIYLDTSASLDFMPPDLAKRILTGHRSDRLLFGTDFPFFDQKKELDALDKTGINPDLKEKILCANARSLLGI